MDWRENLWLGVRIALGPLHHLFCPEPAEALQFLNFRHCGAVGHLSRQWGSDPALILDCPVVALAQPDCGIPRGWIKNCFVWNKSEGEERGSISAGKKNLGVLCLIADHLYPSLSVVQFPAWSSFHHGLWEEDHCPQTVINTLPKLT